MIEIKKLNQKFYTLLELLFYRRAEYIARYKLKNGEGFSLHYHPKVDEYIILTSGKFILKYGESKESLSKFELSAEDGPILIILPKEIWHTLIGISDESEYIVVKEYNDAMLF